MNFKSISARILFSFGILIVIIMSYLVYSIYSNIQTNKATEQIIENELDILVADYELAGAIHARIAAARGYILTGNPTYKYTFQEYVTLATETDAIILESASTIEEVSQNAESLAKQAEELNEQVQKFRLS